MSTARPLNVALFDSAEYERMKREVERLKAPETQIKAALVAEMEDRVRFDNATIPFEYGSELGAIADSRAYLDGGSYVSVEDFSEYDSIPTFVLASVNDVLLGFSLVCVAPSLSEQKSYGCEADSIVYRVEMRDE